MHYKLFMGSDETFRPLLPNIIKHDPEAIWLQTSLEPFDSSDNEPLFVKLSGKEGLKALQEFITLQNRPLQILKGLHLRRPITLGKNTQGPYSTFAGQTFFGETLEDAIEALSEI